MPPNPEQTLSLQPVQKPLVAIVGRPNVGKSTLFNRLVGKRIAIVEDTPGITRDRLYAEGDWNGREYTLVDTGGIQMFDPDPLKAQIRAQAEIAMEEADVIVLRRGHDRRADLGRLWNSPTPCAARPSR